MKKILAVILTTAAIFFSACSGGDAEIDLAAAGRVNATYTVTFDANGGSGTMNAQEFKTGVSERLSANTFTRSLTILPPRKSGIFRLKTAV